MLILTVSRSGERNARGGELGWIRFLHQRVDRSGCLAGLTLFGESVNIPRKVTHTYKGNVRALCVILVPPVTT